MKPKLEELKQLQLEKENEVERRKLAIELNICPECGEPIIQENKEILDNPKWYIKTKTWDVRLVCSKDKTHYEEKRDFVSFYPG